MDTQDNAHMALEARHRPLQSVAKLVQSKAKIIKARQSKSRQSKDTCSKVKKRRENRKTT
eukprot:1158368-Pelagomonas_calceolata.AAC.3